MSHNPMLDSLAHRTDSEQSAKSPENNYATPQLSIPACANKAETRLAHKFFDQIPDAADGSLVVHHARGSGEKIDLQKRAFKVPDSE